MRGVNFHDLYISCGTLSGCQIYNGKNIDEGSGMQRVSMINSTEATGPQVTITCTNGGCGHFLFDNDQVALTGANDAILLTSSTSSASMGDFRHITCNNSGGTTGLACIHVVYTGGGGGEETTGIYQTHMEGFADTVFMDTGASGIVQNIDITGTATNTLHLATTKMVTASAIFCGVSSSNCVINDTIGASGTISNASDIYVAHYTQTSTSQGLQVYWEGGASNFTNILSTGVPSFSVRSTATSGATSRSQFGWYDGNNNGWEARFEADAANDPLQFYPVTAGSVGSLAMSITDGGALTVSSCTGCGGTYYQTVQDNGSAQTQEPALNLIPGSNVTISCADDSGISTGCTIASSATGSAAFSALTASTNTNTGSFNSADGSWVFGLAGAASTPGVDITGAPYTAGSGTTNTPQLYLDSGGSPTNWSANGTFFGVSAPSTFSGNFEQFDNNGTSEYSLSSLGTVTTKNVAATTGFQTGASSHLVISGTAPTVSSGFGTSASITANNGSAAFRVGVGTSNTGTGVIGLPTATTGWNCQATDITTTNGTAFITKQTASTTTTATLQNYTDVGATGTWTDSDVLAVSCFAY